MGCRDSSDSLPLEDLHRENLKANRVGRVIENEPVRFRTGPIKREYHALTRGWIVNEIFRRVDPAGRTMGEYLREEVAGPLDADVRIGVEEDELDRIVDVQPMGIGWTIRQLFRPAALGRRLGIGILWVLRRFIPMIWRLRDSTAERRAEPFDRKFAFALFNTPALSMGETSSAGAKASARGLAKVAAMMAARGRHAERAYLSPAAWDALHANAVEADMGLRTNFTQGGVHHATAAAARRGGADADLNAGREGFYGWMGLGGSVFQWHPELEIGFAFVPTSLHAVDVFNTRGKAYQAEVLRCVERIQR